VLIYCNEFRLFFYQHGFKLRNGFLSLILTVIGAGFFKPLISGTIARSTNEQNSTLGFGIFYWSINLGAFIFPLLLVPYLKAISWSYIFIMAAVGTGSLLFLNLFMYKEPPRPKSSKTLGIVMKEMLLFIKDYRFMSLITFILVFGFYTFKCLMRFYGT